MGTASSVQVVGVIRFSVLAEGFAVDLYGGMEKLRHYLFEGPSLGWRLPIFEQFCLPAFLRQSDTDFQLVLLTSTELPDWARTRLDAMVAPYPNIHVYAEPVGKQYVMIRNAYDSVPYDGYSHRAAFRLDNDDALCTTFVERVRRLVCGLIALHDGDEPTVIAFNRGNYLQMNEDAPHEVYDTVERKPLSTGTTLVTRVGHRFNPYRFNHRALAQHCNLYSDISFPGFIRSLHSENADRGVQKGRLRQHPPRRVARGIAQHFGVEIDTLRGLPCLPREA